MAEQEILAAVQWWNLELMPGVIELHPHNYKDHPEDQLLEIATAIRLYGWGPPCLINLREINGTRNRAMDGNGRVMIARDPEKYGLDPRLVETIPCRVCDVEEGIELAILATVDPLGDKAIRDPARQLDLARLVEIRYGELPVGYGADVMKGLAEAAEKLRGLGGGGGGGGAEEPSDDLPEEVETRTKTGQIWTLGGHRLMVGDCTKPDDVARLMDGDQADMGFWDPPYGVDYNGGTFRGGTGPDKRGVPNTDRQREKLDNDEDASIYGRHLPVCLPWVNGPVYMCFADGGADTAGPVWDAVRAAKAEVHATIIWAKTNATFSALNACYKPTHEAILFFKPKGSTLRWSGPNNERTVWEIARDARNDYHPTQKPVALPLRALGNHEANLVVDFFGGSGSTLMAAEAHDMACYTMELDPAKCDVILARWEQETGNLAELLENPPE